MKRASLVLTLFTLGCPPPPGHYPGGGGPPVQGGAKPRWVDTGKPAQYPEMQYMTGVGTGKGRVPCNNDARASIAKIFEANIRQVSRDWQGHFSRVNSSGAGIRIEAMSVEQLTQVSTDYTLKGIEIKEIWEGEGAMYCLAVLDRVAAAQNLRAEIQKLDAEIQANIQEGDRNVSNKTARFMAYKKAMEAFQRRQALNADLRIVNPQRTGVEPRYGWQALVAKFTRAKSRIKIGFQLKGRERAKVQSCLGEELTKQGIQVMEGSSDVDLWIHGKIDMKRAGHSGGAFMVRATLLMRITNADDGKTIGSFSRDIKAGRPTLPASIQLAASKLCFDVAPKLSQEIMNALSR